MIGTEVIQRLSGFYADRIIFLNKIRKWWTPVWEFLTFSLMDGVIIPRRSLSVSIERGAVWVVSASKFLGRLKIKGSRRYAFEEGKYVRPDALASTLAMAGKELRASRVGITLSIPRDWAIIRTVELPAAVKENIIDVMGYELDRLTPLSADDAYYDFKILGEKEGRLDVLVVAARAALLNQYLEALRNENLAVERVSTNLAGLNALCSELDPAADCICLQIDPFGYEGGFIHNHEIVQTFGGAFSEQESAGKAETMAQGVGPSIELAKSLGLIPQVFVSTRDKTDAGLGDLLDVPVTVLDRKDFGRKVPSMDDDISHTAVGAALESLLDGQKGLNILGKGVRRKVNVPKAMTMVLILLLFAAWVPYVVLPLQREEKRLQEINRQISIRKDEVKKVEALKKEVASFGKEVAAIDDFKESRPMALVLLKELTTNLPKTVWLTRARITETTADIEGYANSASEILPKLEQSKFFKKVEFASPTIRDTRLNADRFVIRMEIEGFTVKKEKEKNGTTEE